MFAAFDVYFLKDEKSYVFLVRKDLENWMCKL